MASSEPLGPSRRLMASPVGLCLRPGQKVPALSCVSFDPCRLPYPGGSGGRDCCSSTRVGLRPFWRGSASATFHFNRFMWLGFRGCRVRFMLRPGSLACPSPTRTFTFELSSHESPHWNVEYDYAAKQSIAAAGLTPARHTAVQAASKMSHLFRRCCPKLASDVPVCSTLFQVHNTPPPMLPTARAFTPPIPHPPGANTAASRPRRNIPRNIARDPNVARPSTPPRPLPLKPLFPRATSGATCCAAPLTGAIPGTALPLFPLAVSDVRTFGLRPPLRFILHPSSLMFRTCAPSSSRPLRAIAPSRSPFPPTPLIHNQEETCASSPAIPP